jgi:hypothetical protein
MNNEYAMEMRAIADKYNEDKKQAIIEKNQKCLEDEVLPTIQKKAERGEYRAIFCVPSGYNTSLWVELLAGIGFTVEQLGPRAIEVMW